MVSLERSEAELHSDLHHSYRCRYHTFLTFYFAVHFAFYLKKMEPNIKELFSSRLQLVLGSVGVGGWET